MVTFMLKFWTGVAVLFIAALSLIFLVLVPFKWVALAIVAGAACWLVGDMIVEED